MSDQISETTVKSLDRISEYPIVKDSCAKVSEYYNWVKDQNTTLNSTLTWTEGSLKTVIDIVEPIASSRLASVDDFACNQLDKLENKYPLIKESSENIKISTNQYYDSSIKPTVDKVVAVKDSAVHLAKTPFRFTGQAINYLSNTTNSFVKKFMSTSEHYKTSGRNLFEKKEYDVLFAHALKEIEIIQHRVSQNIDGLSKLLFSIYDQTIIKNQSWITKYYETYLGKPQENTKTEGELPKLELSLMDVVAKVSNNFLKSVKTLSTVYYNDMSSANKEKMNLILSKTDLVYTTLSKLTLSDVHEQLSIDNVKLIGQNTVCLLSDIKESLSDRYKEDTGKAPCVDTTVVENFNIIEEVSDSEDGTVSEEL